MVKKIKKLIVLYVLWTVVYMPMGLYHLLSKGLSVPIILGEYLVEFLVTGQHYNSWPLWYLLSSIYALTLIYLLMKMKLNKKVMIIVGVMILIPCKLLPTIFGTDIGRILTGAVYIPIGVCLTNKSKSKLFYFGLLFVCILIEMIINNKFASIYMQAIIITCLFQIIRMVELKDSHIYFLLRRVSRVVYFIHMYVWTAYYMIAYGEKTYGMDSFIFTSCVSVLIAIIYCCIISKRYGIYL